MKILFIIIHLTNGAIAEATVSVVAPKILCGDAIKTIAVLSTKESTIKYKGNKVYLYYCKNKKGEYVE